MVARRSARDNTPSSARRFDAQCYTFLVTTLAHLSFDNHFARLGSQFSTALPPTPVPEPYVVSVNPDAAALIDLDPVELHTAEFLRFVSGHRVPPGSDPVAMLYAGHQFGVYVPQLGDGRAILIGQVRNQAGQSWDLQLKGAGETPYSRFADGRAVLRSSIREYLGSEAMHHLGIPTSRALAVVGSDLPIIRETVETAAVLLRMAPSHVRFGSFEVFYYRQQHDRIRTLADYVIGHFFTEVDAEPGSEESHFRFFREVVVRTARMIAQWQAVGFAHGVMNTDNMSILGITFDYGPFGFVEAYDPDFICNHSDDSGRYAFSNQPPIAYWNLCALAQALTPLLSIERCKEALAEYEPEYLTTYEQLIHAKMGLIDAREEDAVLINDLFSILRGNEVDYTMFFRALSGYDAETDHDDPAITALFKYPEAFTLWSEGYRARIASEAIEQDARHRKMRAANPRYILRNWLAQRAIERAQQKDFAEVDRLLEVLRRPFDDQPGFEEYAGPAPAGYLVAGVSCSS